MVTHYFFSGSSQLIRVAFHATVCNDINSMPHGNVRKNGFHLFLYPGMDVFLISGEACAVYFISLWDGKIFSFQSASLNFPSPFPYMIQFFEPLKLKGGEHNFIEPLKLKGWERCILFWVRLVIVCLSVCLSLSFLLSNLCVHLLKVGRAGGQWTMTLRSDTRLPQLRAGRRVRTWGHEHLGRSCEAKDRKSIKVTGACADGPTGRLTYQRTVHHNHQQAEH